MTSASSLLWSDSAGEAGDSMGGGGGGASFSTTTKSSVSDDSAGDAGRFVSEAHCWRRDLDKRSSKTRCARRAPRSTERGAYFDGGRAGRVGGLGAQWRDAPPVTSTA